MTQVAEPRTGGVGGAPVAERVNHWIGGRLVAGTSGRRGPVYNPATGQAWPGGRLRDRTVR